MNNLIGSGAEMMARGLDKDAEYQADRIGVVLATRAGYDAYGLPMVLQEIGHAGSMTAAWPCCLRLTLIPTRDWQNSVIPWERALINILTAKS